MRPVRSFRGVSTPRVGFFSTRPWPSRKRKYSRIAASLRARVMPDRPWSARALRYSAMSARVTPAEEDTAQLVSRRKLTNWERSVR